MLFNCLAIKLRLGLLGPLCKNIKFFVLAEESVDKTFWKSLGANVEFMDADHHDLVLAVTSHAPHLIAYTMVGVADD